jgi:hypothetical protein
MTKNQKISRNVNGITVEQRVTDGFINGTAMCVAHGKEISDWFRNRETIELLEALALDLDLEINPGISQDSNAARISAAYPELVISKRGSPKNGGGTWLHPDLAIQLAQWCSALFAIQVSRWVREWMTTGQNPVWSQADIDRVEYRDALKDEARLRMTDQVKIYLEQIRRYDDKKYRGIFFAKVHDGLNTLITTETSKQMRVRLSQLLGREVKECELIRDYFPAIVLQRYISMCEAAANLMIREDLQPLSAVERAAEIVLPANYLPTPIDFVEHIKLARYRVAALSSGQGSLDFF